MMWVNASRTSAEMVEGESSDYLSNELLVGESMASPCLSSPPEFGVSILVFRRQPEPAAGLIDVNLA